MMSRLSIVILSVSLFGFLSGSRLAFADDLSEIEEGLEVRIMGVAPDSDEQSPDWESSIPQLEFLTANEVTILVQIKNVSDQPISYHGIRYGNNVSEPWAGRSSQKTFGPQCFSIQVFDESGSQMEFPISQNAGRMFSQSRTETLEPGDTENMLIKPISWDDSLASILAKGKYQIQISFTGAGEGGIFKSPKLNLEIQRSHKESRHSLNWGEPSNGIRAAAEYRLADTRAENAAEFRERAFPIDSKIDVRFYFQNTTNKPIEFSSPVYRQDDQTFWVKDSGDVRLQATWYSGITPQKTWTVQSKQIVVIPAIAMGFCEELGQEDFPHAIGPVIFTEPGEIKVRHDLQGGYSTGTSIIKLRKRKPSDEPKRLETFLQFKKPDGSFAKQGFVKVTSDYQRHPLYEGRLSGEKLNLDSWTGGELRVFARVPDCQEETFYFIKPDANPVIALTAGSQTTIRLVDSKGNPIEGALVRQFAWTHEDSGGYPFPMSPTGGDVLATSDENGRIKLTSLDGATAKRSKIYTFYVDPGEGFAPQFVGPIKAGVDLGDIELGERIEISGVIEGTKEELENFAAEWDQPVELILGNGNVSSLYANSAKLIARRDGDKITFQLSNLRPGKLRIIANFSKRPHSVSHTYGRRDAKGTDQLFEFDLTESRDDIVIKAGE